MGSTYRSHKTGHLERRPRIFSNNFKVVYHVWLQEFATACFFSLHISVVVKAG